MPGKSVQRALHLQHIDEDAQGHNGPIQASYSSKPHDLDKAWVETFNNMGYPMQGDTMSVHSLGGYQVTAAVDPKTRERSHAGNAYLGRTQDRPNVEIVGNVLVDRLDFTSDDPPGACGVRFVHKNQAHSIRVDKEVILCGADRVGSSFVTRQCTYYFHFSVCATTN